MYEALLDFFISKPARLSVLGSVLFRCGASLIFLGTIANLAMVAPRAVLASVGGMRHPEMTFSELFPGLWTWWVPETAFGYVLSAAIALVGLWLALTGNAWNGCFESGGRRR